MKKKLGLSLLSLLLITAFNMSKAEAVEVEWSQTFGGTNYEYVFSAQQTSDGGYIMAGRTSSFGAGSQDVWLVKTDSLGNKLWDRTFGGTGKEYAYFVRQTSDGGYIMAGGTDSFGAGARDAWLIKTDSLGNKLWDKTFGGPGDDIAYAVQQTTDGGYIITGQTNADVWLIKTDALGNKLWDKTYGGSNWDFGTSVQQTSDGGYILAGETFSYGAGAKDAWLIKTDSFGNKLWDKTFGGIGDDSLSSVQQTSDGGYIMVGGTASFGAGGRDIWLIKTDSLGNKSWDKTFGGTGDESGYAVQQTTDGNYIIVGYTTSFGAGGWDIWLIKTDSLGNKLWDQTFGGPNDEIPSYSLSQTADGGYFVAGTTNSYGAGATDFWLVKLHSDSLYTLNLANVPWYQNVVSYSSTGAAVSQMIINFIRTSVGATALTQDEIYQYAKSPLPYGPELNPDEIAKALGHFDPYDALISGQYDQYDSLPGGNPYQGYNFGVEAFDPLIDSDALNHYMRDICHWMSYTVTKEYGGTELVAAPNTPVALPIYGTYNHWVTVKGFSTSVNPWPDPHGNPGNTPDFTIYGYWIKDPLVSGIGQDIYKTAAECKVTYFLPLTTTDNYNGKFVHVAEPPPQVSKAKVQILQPTKDYSNLVYIGIKEIPGVTNIGALPIKQGWQDILPAALLQDPDCKAAFNASTKMSPVLVKRTDDTPTKNLDYYLLPFNKLDKQKRFLTSAVVILDANAGYFKEASWTKVPEKFLKVNDKDAIGLIVKYLIYDRDSKIKQLPKMPLSAYQKQLDALNKNYGTLIEYVTKATAQAYWQPSSPYSQSPYRPYWRVDANGYIFYVTQEGKIVCEMGRHKILAEIETNRAILQKP